MLVGGTITRGVSGLARYDAALFHHLGECEDMDVALEAPISPPLPGAGLLSRMLHLDVQRFLGTYPLRPLRGSADLFHLTYQSLASMLWRLPRQPVVVTVHDIFPYLYRDDPGLSTYAHLPHRVADAFATHQLGRATALITDCGAVRDDLVRRLGIGSGRIHVVPLGIDHQRFRRGNVPGDFWERHQLDQQARYALHVSSEEPRKNVGTLLRAWRKVVDVVPDAVLLKVGRTHYPRERGRMLADIAALGLERSVRIVDAVSDMDLGHFYNAAKVFAFPSVAEGFGFPPLEAMACGTPVVCSDTPALEELVGEAAVRVPTFDADALAAAMIRVLVEPEHHAALREAGLARAAQFTWERTADMTRQVYFEVLESQAARAAARR